MKHKRCGTSSYASRRRKATKVRTYDIVLSARLTMMFCAALKVHETENKRLKQNELQLQRILKAVQDEPSEQ